MTLKWIGSYAGYSHELVEYFSNEIKEHYDSKSLKLLEPMCGSGNLLVKFEIEKVPYLAYDINPVQVIQCNAKIANLTKLSLASIRQDIKAFKVKEIQRALACREWFSQDAISCLLELFNKIDSYSTSCDPDVRHLLTGAFVLTLRRNACIAASSNPTWLKKGGTIPGTNVKETFIAAYDFINLWHKKNYSQKRMRKYGDVSCRDINNIKKQNFYDICIVSPPYCNRLDYKRMFAPEYYFVTNFIQNDKEKAFMGNNEVRGFDDSSYHPTAYEILLLRKIRLKQAPENKDYYFKYYSKYFKELDLVLIKIMDSLKPGGVLFINVQNSHYKEVEINLDEVIKSKIEEKHIVSELYSKQKTFFGNLLKANKRQKETLLGIVKK